MRDARESIIPRRLEQVSTVLPLMSYKGEWGKLRSPPSSPSGSRSSATLLASST